MESLVMEQNQTHELKCWPEFFQPLVEQLKTFEHRLNDRNFQVGDTLRLREWNPTTREYTGRETLRKVTWMMNNPASVLYCIMGIAPIERVSREQLLSIIAGIVLRIEAGRLATFQRSERIELLEELKAVL